MVVVGIAPGKTGACALLLDGEYVACHDWESGPRIPELLDLWNTLFRIDMVVLEKVHSMPKQGVVSTFSFGTNYGWWLGVIDALQIPVHHVTPQAWTRSLPPKTKPTDKPALQVARELFPGAPLKWKKDHNRADAIMIARWYNETKKEEQTT